jgi:uncharacterized protein (UPF0147 family)
VHAPVGGANDQRRLEPRSLAHRLREIAPGHHQKQSDQRRFSVFEYHWPAANDRELGRASGGFNPLLLFLRKHAREHAARREMSRRDDRIVRDVTAQLEAACDFLRMVAVDPGVERKIRRAAEDEVETLIRRERARLAEISVAYFVPRLEPVVRRRLARQPDALVLRFDRHDACAWQPPGGDHSDRSDPRAEVEQRRGAWRPRRPVPCRQHIVG